MRVLVYMMVFIAFIFVLAGLVAFFSNRGENKRAGLKNADRRLRAAESMLDQIEECTRNTLVVNPGDLTAQEVFGIIKSRRRELR